LAHNTLSVFQKTTENLIASIPSSVFVQLHGFGKRATDPYVILSNGTRTTPSIDYATLLKDALYAEDNTLTFKLAHIDTDWTRLIGFTNTQGRMINNSSNFCNTPATAASGRFIHIEQEKLKLRNSVTGWSKMRVALEAVFSSTLDVATFNLESNITITPNPTISKIIIQGKQIQSVNVFNLLGQHIRTINNKNKEASLTLDLKNEIDGIYFIKVVTSKGFFTKKIVLLK